MEKEFAHYVVTAHQPGGVLVTTKCNFLAPDSMDVLVAKSRRLEIRQLRAQLDPCLAGSPSEAAAASSNSSSSPFPIIAQVPINGRIICLKPLQIPSMDTSAVFVATDRLQYAVLCHDAHATSPHCAIRTLASGSLRNNSSADGSGGSNIDFSHSHANLARLAESGPLVAVDPWSRCIAMHVYDGMMSLIPVNAQYAVPATTASSSTANYKDDGSGTIRPPVPRPRLHSAASTLLGPPVHLRMEERTVLDIQFLHTPQQQPPQLVVLHQDARGGQHVSSHLIQLASLTTNATSTGRGSAGNGNSGSNNTTALSGGGSLKKSNVDGGSSLLIAVPPRTSHAATASAASSSSTESDSSASSAGGMIILGQRQFTYCNGTVTKVIPVPQALFLSFESLPVDPVTLSPRYLVADEFGNLHMLTLLLTSPPASAPTTASTSAADKVVALTFETLGSCALASSLTYLRDGLVHVGSNMGDSQLVQIHDEPIAVPSQDMYSDDNDNNNNDATGADNALVDTTYLSVVEEYTHLGPILDFDLIPTTPGTTVTEASQCQVVTASGSSKTGSLRLVRNGIGMNEYASVEMPGIQQMWSVRESFDDTADKYLVQSFVGETRVLGVAAPNNDKMDEEEEEGSESEVGASLEEMEIPGLNSESASLFVGNVQSGDRVLQITEAEIRLFAANTGHILSSCAGNFTVATANEAGQIAVSMPGGMLGYYAIDESGSINKVSEKKMEREISCLDIHPFAPSKQTNDMDIDGGVTGQRSCDTSSLLAVGLWDDFTVRLLALESNLKETICINLGNDDEDDEEDEEGNIISQRRHINNMMARSLCLATLDFNSSSPGASAHAYSRGVDMLLVGLGDGTLISFAVVTRDEDVSVQAKKVVCLGTQRIGLVPLSMAGRGTCVLATGDRPTVIYLAGVGGTSSTQFNPKLCYSNVNLSASEETEGDDVSRLPSQQTIAVNVATPFLSPLLFDAGSLGPQHFSLCVADDKVLKLGVIDDIQKLHVTTCRIGMAPRRIAHCADGRLFAVGCIESGIHLGLGEQEQAMLNCIRFMDDTSFDDIERFDMEPFEMIMSMAYVTLKIPSTDEPSDAMGVDGEVPSDLFRPFLLVGTAYALPDEDEPTRGRILVYSFQEDESSATASNGRCIRQVTELATQGAVYNMSQFYDGKVLCSVNSKTNVAQLVDDAGVRALQFMGTGHHGHIISLVNRSLAKRVQMDSIGRDVAGLGKGIALDMEKDSDKKAAGPEEMLAIVGDLMRSISLVQYYPEHDILEEIAKDFNANWVTAIEMLSDRVFLGAENWNNLFCLRRNVNSQSEEIRCRLDNIGEFHFGEMVNKFMRGSLVMPLSSSASSSSKQSSSSARQRSPQKKQATTPNKRDDSAAAAMGTRSVRRPVVTTGSQTLFGTVDGTLGVILGVDGRTAAFFGTLERALAEVIRPIGDFSHAKFRAVEAENRLHPAHGFIDGDLVESFLDLDRNTMQAVADEMNRDGGWEVDDSVMLQKAEKKDADMQLAEEEDVTRQILTVDDILAMVEEITMLH